jgi:RecG-like helicase
MSLGALIKRQKRTLINFQESFLIPFITKAAHRYMQFDPEHYPVKDYKFNVVSSLGIIAREYEVSQLIQLLQTMSQESPLYSTLIQSVVENMNLSNREEMVALIQQSGQKSPEQQQAEQQAAQEAQALQKALQEAQIGVLNGQAEEFLARAKKYDAETKAVPVKLETEQIKTIGELDSDDERNFKQRVEIARLAIAEKGKGRR